MPQAKSALRSLRNRLEVGRKRAVFGVTDARPLHTMLLGSKGMDFEGLAKAWTLRRQQQHGYICSALLFCFVVLWFVCALCCWCASSSRPSRG